MNQTAKIRIRSKSNFTQLMLFFETIVIFGVFQVLTGGTFMTARNLTNILLQGCVYSIMGIGITFVMVSGNMDLSGGSVLGMLCAIGGVLQMKGLGTLVTMFIMIAVGLLVGAWQGYWVAYRKLPAFIVTLAGMLTFRGLCLLVGDGGTVGPVSDSFQVLGSSFLPTVGANESKIISIVIIALITAAIVWSMATSRQKKLKNNLPVENIGMLIAKTAVLVAAMSVVAILFCSYRGIPYAVLLLAALAGIFSFVSQNTVFGRYVFAIGGNSEASRLAGVNTKRMVLRVYILMGFFVSIASIVYLGRVGSATANAGKDFEFSAITGCIVGGVSTIGGIGSIPYAILGAMLMQGIDNGMSLMNLGATFQYIVRGLVLLLAVAIDVASKSRDRAV